MNDFCKLYKELELLCGENHLYMGHVSRDQKLSKLHLSIRYRLSEDNHAKKWRDPREALPTILKSPCQDKSSYSRESSSITPENFLEKSFAPISNNLWRSSLDNSVKRFEDREASSFFSSLSKTTFWG